MARYRKIDPRIWNDAKFRGLSDTAKLLFFMLLTHPSMTSLGAMRATVAGLAAEMGWASEDFGKAFQEVIAKGMAEHDPEACYVGLPKFIRYNQPESPNVVKAWAGALDLLPECEYRTRTIARAEAYAQDKGQGFADAFREGFSNGRPKTMPNQEQKLEHEQQQDVGGYPPTTPSTGNSPVVAEAACETGSCESSDDKQVSKKHKQKSPAGLISDMDLPDWLPAADWSDFVEMRCAMGKSIPFTPAAAKAILTKLKGLRDLGHDPSTVLAQSVRKGWRDVFPVQADFSAGRVAPRKSRYAAAGVAIFGVPNKNREVIDVG